MQQLRSLEHFTILKVLGRGGMGVVYLARDERLGRHVALKVVSEYEIPDAERRTMFLREAGAAAAIKHPNVATIYEVGETRDRLPFIVMEYCEGQTASQLGATGIDAGRFINIARQIADGLAAAHQRGVIHRDIKGANIIVEPGDVVKILDFGLAKVLRTAATNTPSSSGAFFGTVPYLSPEQARGSVADARSDLFSTGVVLYELATGRLPFNAEGPLALLAKIRDEEPQPFVPHDPTLPEPAARIIGKLLQKEPADRYQTAEELAEDLSALWSGVDRADRHITSRTSPLGRTIRRRSTKYLLSATALAILVIVSVLFIETPDRPTGESITPIRSIAVLPFQNLSGRESDSFLSVGLADALVTRLQQIPSLQVRPTSAILKFSGSDVDPEEAARQLQVDGVLQGRFVNAGGVVRVNLQLTDTRTGYGVWAGTVDGRRDNLIMLMDSVSSGTATALTPGQAPPRERLRSEPRSDNPAAFEYFVRARALADSLVPEHHAEQVEALRKAIELDPRFAAAYAELSIALTLGQIRGLEKSPDTLEQAERYARQAVKLDPNLAEAHLALGRMLVRYPDRFRESARENLAALRLNPRDPDSMYTLASYLISAGELRRAECAANEFLRLDPSSNNARTVGYFYVNAVDPERTMESADRALASPDTRLAGHDLRALAFILQNDLTRAEEEQRQAAQLVPDHYIPKSLAAMIASARGNRPEAERWIGSLRADAMRNHWAALRVMLCYAKLGDRQKAIEWARHTTRLGNHSWYFLVKHPWLQSLQAEPAYQEILRKIKNDLDDVRDDVIGVYQLICREPLAS